MSILQQPRKKWKYKISSFPEPYRTLYTLLSRQGYILVGRHSVVKKCHWTHVSLTEGRYCYKCKFYGIESHRDIQMSPAALWCWNACIHCWRLRPTDTIKWDDTKLPWVDDPELIVEGSIEAYRDSLMGYWGHPRIKENHLLKKKLEEALNPVHVAISLTGEPLLYPRIGELIEEYHRRGFTTFLVTRGIRPDILAEIEEEPTQLYVSIEAWDKESYEYFDKPLVPRAWELNMKTIELLPTFSSMTTIRFTVIRKWAEMVESAQPTYIEVKSYMHVGASRQRLSRNDMLRHIEVLDVAKKLADLTGYNIVSHQIESRVVLLSKLSRPIRVGKGCPEAKNEEKEIDLVVEALERGKLDEVEYILISKNKI